MPWVGKSMDRKAALRRQRQQAVERKQPVTTIVVDGEKWKVPRGFGREYLRMVKLGSGDGLRDLLGLIGYDASAETISSWTFRQRVEATVYAANVHLRASDNAIQAHPQPTWFPPPWQGPEGKEPLDGPGPTVLPISTPKEDGQ